MKRLKFGNKKLNIRSETLHKLIECSLACQNLTRSALAERTAVSQVTVGKLLSALDECGFTDLCYATESGASYPSKNHIFRKDVSVLVLDFSSFKYTATIVFGKCHKATTFDYFPDPALSFESNATVFLSKAGKNIASLPYCVSAICTIIADDPQCLVKTASLPSSYLPQEEDMLIISDICIRFFSVIPALCLTYSQAVKCALKYDIFQPCINYKNVSHIRMSDTFEVTLLPSHSSPAPIKLNKLIISGERLSSLWERTRDIDEAAQLLAHVISLIDCVYDGGIILMEYDNDRFSGIEKRLTHVFRAANSHLPNVAYYDFKLQAATLGAATASLGKLISSQITGI